AELASIERFPEARRDLPNGLELQLERARLLAALGSSDAAAGALRELLSDEGAREFELPRQIARFRLAELEATASPGAATTARLESARREARAAKLGWLLGEEL